MNNSQTKTYELDTKTSLAYKLTFASAIGFDMLLLYMFLWGSIIMLIVTVILLMIDYGIELDFENYRYRNVKIFMNKNYGKWLRLPQIQYISVFPTTLVSSIESGAATRITSKEHTILINLIHNTNKRLTVYKTDDIDDAISEAKYLSEKLNVRIFDASYKKGRRVE
jgi:hypothetical protein